MLPQNKMCDFHSPETNLKKIRILCFFFCDGEPPKGKNKPIKREGKLKRRHVDNNRKGMKYLWKKSFGFHSKATDIITTSNLNVNVKEMRCNSPMP